MHSILNWIVESRYNIDNMTDNRKLKCQNIKTVDLEKIDLKLVKHDRCITGRHVVYILTNMFID